MVKYLITSFILCFVLCALSVTTVSAQSKFYGWPSWNIIQVVDAVQQKNPVVHSIFEQKVRTYANGNAQWFGTENRIANGAWILVEAISPYIQWMVFIGMSLSVILIIYNGFMIVANAGDDGQIKSAKDNVKHIIIGVLILGWFYFILRIVSGLLLNLIWV